MSQRQDQMIVDLQKRIAELEAGNKASTGSVSCKVSEKGAVSLYGLQRFPITLYWQQWERLFLNIDTIKAFIVANRPALATKVDTRKPAAPAVVPPSGPSPEVAAALAVADRVLGVAE